MLAEEIPTSSGKPDAWLLDSGAARYMTPGKQWFVSYSKHHKGKKYYLVMIVLMKLLVKELLQITVKYDCVCLLAYTVIYDCVYACC